MKKVLALILALAMSLSMLTACGGGNSTTSNGGDTSTGGSADNSGASGVPNINDINVGEDYQDITATVKILTNRTDIVDTVYAGYAEQFHELYPNITVEYEGITDYEETLQLRLPTGDWGDICFIPTSVAKADLSSYFIPLGDYDTLDAIYNFCEEKNYDGTVYGIANGGTADGVLYNKRIWEEAGITDLPTTPEDFLKDLQLIKDNTDSIPLYTNFAAGWTMGAWDSYIWIPATGDTAWHNDIVHTANPFSDRGDQTGPYAVYYTLYESVARGLIEEDPMSTDWESSKSRINNGEIATMVLGSWAVAQCQGAGDNADDLGYMPFPISIDGQQSAGAGGNYSYGINNQTSTDQQIASLIYTKWLLEESTIFEDEGSIPALKSAPMPDVLSGFDGVNLLSNDAAPAGEEDLFDNLNNESEVGLNNDDYPDCEILEAALTGSQTLDELMDSWNAKWTAGQESLGIEVNQ